MSESRVLAPCRDCGKSFRVPTPGKKYRCKCGGVIDATQIEAQPEGPSDAEEEIACPSCGALNPAGAKFCDACGEDLTAKRRPAKGEKLSRQQVGVELRKARKSISLVRFLFGFSAVVSALLLLFLYLGLIAEPSVAAEPLVLAVLGFATLQLGLASTGYIRAHMEPFLWAVLLASLSTLNLALSWPEDGANPVRIAWTLFLWTLVPATVRVRKLLKEHPDHYAVQALQGTYADARGKSKDRGPMGARRAEELRQLAQKRANKRTLVTLGVIFSASAALATMVLMRQPATAESTVDAFEADWNAGDTEALGERFARLDYNLKDKWDQFMRGPIASDLPALGERTKNELEGSRAEVYWETAEGELAMRWQLTGDGEWQVTGFAPPSPGIGDLPRDFQIAWNSGTFSRVTELCQGEDKERMAKMLPVLVESRGWLENGRPKLPQVGGPRVHRERNGRHDYKYDSDAGEFRVTFRVVESGTWALTKIDVPRQPK